VTRISVVIPVFNGERFLGQAIESVLAQTLPAADVIVVDDGSTDGSAAVAESFGPVRLVRIAHQGAATARNSGVAHSSGELIAFLDADDLMKPDRLERQLAAIEQPPGADFVLGRGEVQVVDGAEPPEAAAAKLAPIAEGSPEYLSMTLLTTRDAFDRVGPFEPGMRFGEDGDWVMRAFEMGLPHALLDEPLIVRRFHADNVTHDTAGARRAIFEILKRRAARHRAGSG
jgi:glycosyltransferase involved in cell wall biosynthesis